MSVAVKRVYDLASPEDGYRVLVDRLWPRGLSHSVARLDLWLRDVAPSTGLRTWYDHRIERWPEFQERYGAELDGKPDLLERLVDLEQERGQMTLLFAARDREHNEANVLAERLRRRLRRATQ